MLSYFIFGYLKLSWASLNAKCFLLARVSGACSDMLCILYLYLYYLTDLQKSLHSRQWGA